MLKDSLIIFSGISYKRQKHLKNKGIITWDDLLKKGKIYFSAENWKIIEEEIYRAMENFEKGNIDYFINLIEKRDHFIIYNDFKEKAVFLDIETTGLDFENDITILGISNYKRNYRVFVNGINLYEENIIPYLRNFKILVTFYGSKFDIPFIRKKYRILGDYLSNMVHIDLCFLGHRVGFKGGLKSIEKQVGIWREEEIKNLGGYDAVKLWIDYKNGKREALIKLIKYNRRDVLNLINLIEIEISLMNQFYFY
ncbi:MAG: ribonuclease H-like domain-containing protein [Thermoplasmata archaeon]